MATISKAKKTREIFNISTTRDCQIKQYIKDFYEIHKNSEFHLYDTIHSVLEKVQNEQEEKYAAMQIGFFFANNN